MPTSVPTIEDLQAAAAELQRQIDALVASQGGGYDDSVVKAEIDALEQQFAKHAAIPDDDVDDEVRAEMVTVKAQIAALQAAPTGGGSSTGGSAFFPGTLFSSLGADDTARFTQLRSKMLSGWKGVVFFELRNHNCPVRLPTMAGVRLESMSATPASEFGTGTVITYTGPAGTSLWELTKNSGYSYPSNGASRDVHARGIQFNAATDRDFLPPAPAGYDANYVQWYWHFPDCSWVGFRWLAKGWGTGLNFNGFLHVQGVRTTPFTLGGSECKIGLAGGFMDSNNAEWMAADLPFFDWQLSKSVLGSVMISARLKSYQMKISYGHNSRAIGTEFDAPDGQPTASYQVRYIANGAGATNFNHIGNSFKGGQGILCQSGTTEVGVDSCAFHFNRGLARCEATFNGVLKWGVTNTYGNCPKVIYVARGNQIINGDPLVVVKSLDGTLTGIRNPDGTYTTAKNSAGAVVPF